MVLLGGDDGLRIILDSSCDFWFGCEIANMTVESTSNGVASVDTEYKYCIDLIGLQRDEET